MDLRPNWVDSLPLDRPGDRALVRTFLRCSSIVFASSSGAALHGDDSVPSRTFKNHPLKQAQEPLKYVTCFSKVRGNGGFPEKASEIG